MIDESKLLTNWATGGARGAAAFAALYEKYNKKVRNDAKRLGRDPDDASQDVWLRLTTDRKNGTLPAFGKFEAYLYRLTQMACSRDALEAHQPPAVGLDALKSQELPATPSTEELVAVSQLSDITNRAVDAMPQDTRNAWAHKRRGDTDSFAAKQLGISEATYQRRVADARAIISECLAKHN